MLVGRKTKYRKKRRKRERERARLAEGRSTSLWMTGLSYFCLAACEPPPVSPSLSFLVSGIKMESLGHRIRIRVG